MFSPLSSTSTQFVTEFCPTRQIQVLGVLRENGTYYKYFFNHKTTKFEPLRCLECQPTVFETDLKPIYAVYEKSISKHIIFCENMVTMQVEQFIFHPETAGFEQVHFPELVFDENQTINSEIVCVVPETNGYGLTIIQKDGEEKFRKMRELKKRVDFTIIPPVYVKTLLMKEMENGSMNSEIYHESDSPHPKFLLQNRSGISVVCALRMYGSYDFFVHENNQFKQVFYEDWATESDLFPVYTEQINHKTVFFVYNQITKSIEQDMFCEKTSGFEQVRFSELKYDSSRSSEAFEFYTDVDEGRVFISKAKDGTFKKELYSFKSQKYTSIPPVQVKDLRMKQKEEEQSAKATKKSARRAVETLDVLDTVIMDQSTEKESDLEEIRKLENLLAAAIEAAKDVKKNDETGLAEDGNSVSQQTLDLDSEEIQSSKSIEESDIADDFRVTEAILPTLEQNPLSNSEEIQNSKPKPDGEEDVTDQKSSSEESASTADDSNANQSFEAISAPTDDSVLQQNLSLDFEDVQILTPDAEEDSSKAEPPTVDTSNHGEPEVTEVIANEKQLQEKSTLEQNLTLSSEDVQSMKSEGENDFKDQENSLEDFSTTINDISTPTTEEISNEEEFQDASEDLASETSDSSWESCSQLSEGSADTLQDSDISILEADEDDF